MNSSTDLEPLAAPEALVGFERGQVFEAGWSIQRFGPGSVLVAAQDRSEQQREAKRIAFALVVPVLLAGLLVAGSRSEAGDLRGVTYPVVALLVAVVVIGLLSLRHSLRRAREGVSLELETSTGLIRGNPESSLDPAKLLTHLRSRKVQYPLSDVRAIRLTVYRSQGRTPNPSARAALSVELEGNPGLHLLGPQATVADAEWTEACDALLPLGCELARIARRPLVVTMAGTERKETVGLEQIDAVAVPDWAS